MRTLTVIAVCILMVLVLSAPVTFAALSAGVGASAPEIPACLPIGKVGTETLYFCDNDYGPDCVWDPSPALGAGVMTCGW